MMKRFLCILLSLMLLCAASLSLAEDTAAAAETAEAVESAEPVLLVTLNGQEIDSSNSYLQNVMAYYLDYAASSGYDTSDPELLSTIQQYSLLNTMQSVLIEQKANELGLNNITDADKAAMEETAKAEWADIIEQFASQMGNLTETSTEEEKAAARADAEASLLENQGYDEARYIHEYTENAVYVALRTSLEDYLLAGKTVTDEEIQAYFNDLVNEDKEHYENDIGSYEFYTKYYQQPSYYTPEGYRGITHILLKVDDELMNNWKDLSARLEEAKSAEEAEATAETATEAPADAEPTEEPTPTPEPVTEDMVKAAEQAILDSVQPIVDEIMAKWKDGASFDDLIKEYGTDTGMMNDATRAEGYPVHKDSIIWDPAFTAAAMALEKIGDVGTPVVGQNGVHILHYLKDVPAGAVELTDEMKEEFRGILDDEMRNEAINTALDQWLAESDVVYTEEGEAWRIPAEDEAEATEEAAPEAAAEEAANP